MLEKLKSLDLTKITSESIKDRINKAIETYDEVNNATYQKLIDSANANITAAEEAIKDAEHKEQERIEKEAKNKADAEQAEIKRIEDERIAKEEEEKKLKTKQMIDNLVIPHLKYLASQNKTIADLPKELKAKNNGVNMLHQKLKKNPENESLKASVLSASEKLLNEIKEWETSSVQKANDDIVAQQQAKKDAELKEKSDQEAAELETKNKADVEAKAAQEAEKLRLETEAKAKADVEIEAEKKRKSNDVFEILGF